ncbi:bifunctional DNA primase/polymerase [Granulicella aggregans]|nr:bifunctional DNA primase/polymerase [Granulicella aggregans]
MLEVALACTARGWHVFPCKPKSKIPATRNGFKDASVDEAQVRAWWERSPDANVAIACGPSRLAVLDIDEGPVQSAEELRAWMASAGLPPTYTVRTGRRVDKKTGEPAFGAQLYYEGAIPDVGLWRLAGGSGQVKSLGGYVMAAGSIHPDSGEAYEVISSSTVAFTPEVVRQLKTGEREALKVVAGKKIPDGAGRHHAMTSVAGGLRAKGLDGEAIYEALVPINPAMCEVPISDDDLKAIAYGVARRYPAGETDPEVVIGKAKEPKEPVDWRTRYATSEQFRDVLPPSFLIRDFLEDGSITAIGAPVAQRKSIVVANVIHALLTGEPLFGHFEVLKRPARILYLCPEMGLVDIASRFKKLGLDSYVGESLFIRTMDDPKLSLTELDEELPGALLILDTITRFVEGNQNDAGDMAKFADLNYAIKRRGATLLLLHHAIKGTGGSMTLDNALRGSTELAAFVTCVWSTQLQDIDAPHTTPSNLKCVKQRGFASEPFQVSCDESFRMTMLGTMGAIKTQKQVSSEAALAEILKHSPDMGLLKLRDALKAAGHKRGVKWIAAAKVAAGGTGVTLTG